MRTRKNSFSPRFTALTFVAIAVALSIGFFLPDIASLVAGEAGDESTRQPALTEVPAVPAAVTFTPAPATTTPTFTLTPVPPSATATNTSAPTAPPTSTSTPVKTHVIQPGETLREIAERYGVSVEDLIEINDIEDADRLLVGEELELPQ